MVLVVVNAAIISNGDAATLLTYTPGTNDNLVGSLNVSGSSETLSGNQKFSAGVDGSVNTALGGLTVTSGQQFIDKPRLDPGPQNFAITVPDPATGGNTIFQVYNTANLVAQPSVTNSTLVPDIQNVGGNQYINARVANVSNGGTLSVNIGSGTASSTASTHAWSMAAKQTSLFNVDGASGAVSTLNWDNNNRISFFGSAATPVSGTRAAKTFVAEDVVTYMGIFSVQTLDGNTSRFTVNNAADLRTYNDWLISQLQAGNLDKLRYLPEFNKAITKVNGNIVYDVTATSPDEATQPVGNVVAINASGANARVNIAANRTLEVSGATAGAVRATNGAQVVVRGKLSSQGDDLTSNTDSSALFISGSGSSGTNSGVINGGFLNRADASGSGIGLTGYGANAVQVQDEGAFTNTGVINLATTGSNTPNGIAAINLRTNANANNTGNINVGVNGSSATGTTSGVLLNSALSGFDNLNSGVIYLGRGPQNSKTEAVADTAMNQSGLTSGIALLQDGIARNYGSIVIGSRVQNGAGMFASDAANANMRNIGTIDVNGRAGSLPRENVGMSVLNSGSGGNILNSGTINLNGINGIGLKVLASNAHVAQAASGGTINVAGEADPASGTRNFGVWAEGQGSGVANAVIDGPINLTGNGAIGVHARGNATVQVANDAVPHFSQGSDQIGFFAYGPNANINVASNSILNVTSSGSALFRVEDGADFDGTDMVLTTSGSDSVGVIGSGSGTDVNTHNASFIISGSGATGVIIEGGANGVIDAATTFDLSGDHAVGAIVDGQKHSLTGENVGSPVATTMLSSAAELNATQDGLTGYIARNSAQLTNSGDITFSGANSTGILVQSGATANNSGTISVNDGGFGMVVNGANQTTTANNSGAIEVNGGTVEGRSRGVSAAGSGAVVNLNAGQLSLLGPGAIGAEAVNGAQVNIAAVSVPTFGNSDQIAYHAVGAGSAINSASTALDIDTLGSTGYRIDDGAVLNLASGSNISASGTESSGVIVSGAGSNLNGNSDFIASGNHSTAIRVEGGGSATLSTDSSITLDGDSSIGVLVDNLRTDLTNALNGERAPTAVTSNAIIAGDGANAIGFDVANDASLIQQGSLTLDGDNSTGIRGRSATSIINSGVLNIANGTGIDISGSGATQVQGGSVNVDDGIAGVVVGSDGFLQLSNATINSAGTAHGILPDAGAIGMTVSDTTINVTGDGNGVENGAESDAVTLDNVAINVTDGSGIRTSIALDPTSTVTTTVHGAGVGFNFTRQDDTPTSTDLVLGDGYQFNVEGAGGIGIRANTTGTVYNSANVSVNNAAGGSALVSNSAERVINSGVLSSQSTVAPVVDLSGGTAATLENHGIIAAPDANGQAVAGSDEADTVLLMAGDVLGDINSGDGSDVVVWTGGVLDGSLSLGAGDANLALVQDVDLSTTRHITSGEGSGNTLSFSQIVARGGSFAEDDPAKGVNLGTGWNTINFEQSQWTLTDNLQLASSTVNIDAASTLYAGNSVHPLIRGGADNSLVVNNAGTLDLTNGSGSPGNTLTIAGDLASAGGQLNLLTRLNEGGALSNQFTDNLRVTGDATTGTTLLNVKLDSLSNGNLTDINHDSLVGGNEGISLVQVAGSARADSFALQGGYLAAGPWRYQLYSFAPGESYADQRRVDGGSNNAFWDYRLGNLYVCETDNSCPSTPGTPTNPRTLPSSPRRIAVIPQVAAYLSAPVGLAYYTAAIIDDLHKRLGELRQQQNNPDAKGGEMFMRYIGSNYSYKSDVSFQNFGYDMDLDYSALQIGGNVLKLDGAEDSLRGGVAYTRGNARLRPKAADGFSSSSFASDSVALYGTWQRLNGFYLDGALSFDWYRGETDISREKNVGKPKGRGWTASLESGYPFQLPYDIQIEPQAQLMYMRLNMNDFTDRDGTTVKYDRYGQTVGRIGARLDRSWTDDASRQYTPYVRANYYHGWGGGSKTTIGATGYNNLDHTFSGGRFGQMWELGVGGTTRFKNDVSLYAEADYRREIDSNGAKGWRYNLGVRWQF
ncbi:autotransporter outer membrane beta-barrel domain-containing protein [Pantoea sp. B65]